MRPRAGLFPAAVRVPFVSYSGGGVEEEDERLQMKVWEKQQADMEKLSTFVRVNRANGVASTPRS